MATSTPSTRIDAPELRRHSPEAQLEPVVEQTVNAPSTSRQVWLAVFVAAAILIPRSLMIARAHSDSYDDDYHLTRGLAFLTRSYGTVDLRMNDPPLGEGLVAVPMLVTNLLDGRAPTDDRLFDTPGRAETLAMRAAVWNSVLFLPLVAMVFVWCRKTYGTRSAWLALGMLLVEPTFAALIPIPTPDILGVSGIVFGCFLAWRYFEQPTTGRLVAAGVAAAAALSLKHTAAILPLVILAIAGLFWVLKPWLDRQSLAAWRSALPARFRALSLMGLVAVGSIWVLTLCDVSPPVSPVTSDHAVAEGAQSAQGNGHSLRMKVERALGLTAPWPAGIYLRAFRTGLGHGMGGHEAYLLGERRLTGWWYYYPVVASYKVPVGIAGVLLLGLLSFRRTPARWAEWGLLIPMLAWTLFLMKSKVNIGFRHFLPPYLFFMMIASRCVMTRSRAWSLAAWSAVGLAGIHAALFSPDYLSYINFPRHKPHLAISDSNIDWGQSLKQVRAWIDARPADGRSISLYRFGKDEGSIRYYLGDRVTTIRDGDDPPTRGLLIISGVLEASPYDLRDVYRTLWPYQPEAVIGHCMLVYDLDKLGGGAPFKWKYPNLPKSGVSIQVHVGHGAPQFPKIAPMVPVGSRSVKAPIPAAIPGVRTIVPAAIPNVRTPLPASVLGVTSSVSAKLPGVNMSVPNTPQNNRGNQPRSGNDGR